MHYYWFLFRTNNLANDLLVTLLGLLLLQLSNSTDPENINWREKDGVNVSVAFFYS